MRQRVGFLGALASAMTSLAVASPALATSLPQRTLMGSVSPLGTPGDGSSQHPALSSTGRVLAFDTTSTNIAPGDANGATRDVVAIDIATNERRLVSQAPGAPATDGPSAEPVLSTDGQRVAFVSLATNLVLGDVNGTFDVFLRKGRDPLEIVSVNGDGVQGNGPSGEADVSGSGTRIAFTSAATNLASDDTNGVTDVFVRDVARRTTVRVSVGTGGEQANGRSLTPAISADGRYVSFTSAASNLVARDTNGVPDVFVRDLERGTTERVSVSSAGRQQNASARPPFVQISDISDDGRQVVFDSDATTLYPQDTNQHTDVFLRDRRRKTTTLVSASSVNVQGNNDSFAPRLGPKGRFLSFESFATNLAAGDGPREDIFVRDLRLGTTSVVTVTSSGAPRGPEQVPQLLQRPAISSDGSFAAFSSTVANLVPVDGNGAEDVFIRLLDAPEARVVRRPPVGRGGRVVLTADDPQATTFICKVDDQPAGLCGREFSIPSRRVGRVLTVRAGGPGMLFNEDLLEIPLSRDRRAPVVTISAPRGRSFREVHGRARDASGISLVSVGIVYSTRRGRCRYLVSPRRFSARATAKGCTQTLLFPASGKRSWRLRLPRAARGSYTIIAQAIDGVGNRGPYVVRRGFLR